MDDRIQSDCCHWMGAQDMGFRQAGRVPASCPPGFQGRYTVVPGDTMFFIAQRFGVSLNALIAANPHIANPNLIFPGALCSRFSAATATAARLQDSSFLPAGLPGQIYRRARGYHVLYCPAIWCQPQCLDCRQPAYHESKLNLPLRCALCPRSTATTRLQDSCLMSSRFPGKIYCSARGYYVPHCPAFRGQPRCSDCR